VSLDANPATNASVPFVFVDPGTGAITTIGGPPAADLNLKARWQGAFFQVGVFF